MTEFEYDCRQKKKIAYGSRHMKRGSRSKRCNLLSDYMTEAQLKKRNGEVLSMNFNQPIEWREFKKFSADLQREYLQNLVDRFGCTAASLAEVFQVNPVTLRRHMQEIDFPMAQFTAGRRMTQQQKNDLRRWMICPEEEKTNPTEDIPSNTLPAAVAAHDLQNRSDGLMNISHTTLIFQGKFNESQVFNTIRSIVQDRTVTLNITIDEVTC